MQKRALITGITGQDGSYLAELLLEKGYEVHGTVKEELENGETLENIEHIMHKIKLHRLDIKNYEAIMKIVEAAKPDECYHLAAQSFTNLSFEEAPLTFLTNINGTHHILEAIAKKYPKCRFYFAGSGDMFGNADKHPQNELTHFKPRNYYSVSKIAGHHLTGLYRQNHGLFACCGILFNHESPRRGQIFVTRKISSTIARIFHGSKEKLKLGDLTARRDWGYSPDYVKAMWLMLQHEKPDDYVIGTGETHSVGEFVEKAFKVAGLDWKEHVEIDKALFRGYEKNILCGDYTKAKRVLGWEPKVKFDELVKIMVEADIEREKKN